MEVNTCSSLGLASGGTRWQLLAIHPAPHYKAAFRLLSSTGVLNQLLTMIQSVPKTALLISRLRIQAFGWIHFQGLSFMQTHPLILT